VTEATFALPIYRWETTASVVDEVLGWWREGRERGEARVLFCYALGKAQRLLAELVDRTEGPVYVHGAIDGLLEPYRAAGVRLAPTEHLGEKLRGRDLAGALVLAPPSAVGTPWMRRFAEAETALASGWMRLRGTRRRRSHDRGFALSDHADFPDLLRTIEESGAARVLATHGHAEELARLCRERGLEASAIRTAWEGEGDA
jgi:putative mRNA 3-end processing factor